jgi:cytochrome P450
VPKGSTITVVPPIIHHKKENFLNPHNFDPERWISGNKVEPFLYIPFGAGERNCIGQYLARIEAKLLLDKILTKYKVKAVHPITMKAAFVYSTIYGDFELKLRNQTK